MKKGNPDLNAKSSIKKSVKMSGVALLSGAVVLGSVSFIGLLPANAAIDGPTVGLGTLESYSVLGGASVTNTGPTVLGGDLGVSPGTAISGFPPGIVGGTVHATDAAAAQAQSDLVIAYNDAAGRASDATLSPDLGGQTLVGGVYTAPSSLGLTGTVTLDGQNNPDSVFIFQVGSTLTTATASNVNLINGASACNVFWQVGSSATLGTASSFKGNILALTSISATTTSTVEGRALARNGSVTLDTNTFTAPVCADAVVPTVPPTTEPTVPPTTPPTTEPTVPATPEPTVPPVTTETPVPTVPAVTPSVPADSSIPLDNPSTPPVDTDIPADSSTNLERDTPDSSTSLERDTPDSSTSLERRTPGDSSTPTTRTTDDSSLTLAKTAAPSPNFLLLGISGLMVIFGTAMLSVNRITRFSRKH